MSYITTTSTLLDPPPPPLPHLRLQDVQYADIDHMDRRLDFTVDDVNFAGLNDYWQSLRAAGMRTVIILVSHSCPNHLIAAAVYSILQCDLPLQEVVFQLSQSLSIPLSVAQQRHFSKVCLFVGWLLNVPATG